MADASFLQANFLGGEWSPYAQGRADEEAYRTGMNLCYNGIPLEVGAVTRRPGTIFCATTRKGVAGVLRQFHFSQNAPYNMEFTPLHMRLFAGQALLVKEQRTVASISTANPAEVAVMVAETWATGDEIEFACTPISGASPAGPSPLFNRQFEITVIDSQHFTLADPVTGAGFDGSVLDLSGWEVSVSKVVDFTTPYTAAQLQSLRVVQDEDTALILHNSWAPRALEATTAPVAGAPAVFSFTTPTFLDGPYLDAPSDGSYLTVSGISGTINVTASSIASINGGAGFVSTDVGRMLRLFSEPDAWASGTTYSKGTNVKYNNAYFQAIAKSTGIEPDTDNGTNWVVTTTAAQWTWALITVILSTSEVTVVLQPGGLLDRYQQPLAGGPLLYNNHINTWQLGLYSDTTGYPTCGCFYEGRFYLAGCIPNRFDATMSNENFNFAPTLLDGTVADNNGMAEILKGEDRNTIFWMVGTSAGIAAGTQGGEWSIQASQLNEPLSPTSIQAHKVTKYGCANVEPRNTGLSHVFVQRYQKQVFEYLTDVFSGKFIGTNISRKAKHLTSDGIAEIAYQAELAPIVWARTNTNKLIGCTYKRESPFSTQPASFMGWHQHTLGSGRAVESIQAGPSPDGTLDSLMLITNDTATGIRYVELLTPIFEETGKITDAWFLDAAVVPTASEVKTVAGHLSVVFYGLDYIAGKTITAWIGGVDAGDYTVSASGTITVPIDGSANPLLTQALLATLTTENDFGVIGASILVTPQGQGFFSPVGAALDYVSSSSAPLHYTRGNFDFDGNRLYHEQATHSGDAGTNGHSMFIFNIKTQAQVDGPVAPGELAFASPGVTCMGYDGNIYYGTADGSNLVGQFNTTSYVNTTYSDTHSLAAAGYVAALTDGTDQFVVVTGLNSGQGSPAHSAPLYIIQMTPTPMAVPLSGPQVEGGYLDYFDEAPGSIAPGNAYPFRGPKGSAFVLCVVGTDAGFYRVGVFGSGTTAKGGKVKITTVAAASIDAAWTGINVESAIYDETDGNVIVLFVGSNSNYYLTKLNAHTGAIMWKILVASSVPFWQSRVRGGRFTMVSGSGSPWTLLEVDTIAGTANTSTTESVIGPDTFASDDKTGQIVVQVGDIGTTDWATFGPNSGGGAITPAGYYIAPQSLGFNYTSKWQILRTIDPQQAGSQNGPAMGKTRRVHMHATLLANTQGVQFGTDFSKPMRTGKLLTAGRSTEIAKNVLFTGVIQDTLEDTYSFNSMWAAQTTRPYPTTIVSVECFLHTQDR
jgi:hypothetical protein